MKALIVGEYIDGNLRESFYELVAFTKKMNIESVGFVVAPKDISVEYEGTIYISDIAKFGEYSPRLHKELIIQLAKMKDVDFIIFSHSSYSWDIAPRIAARMKIAQISEIIDTDGEFFIVPFCNGKLRRKIGKYSTKAVLTLQSGAFDQVKSGFAKIEEFNPILSSVTTTIKFLRYKKPEKKEIDLTKADIIVSIGRGIGKRDNIEMINNLAKIIGGEIGASRPVVDTGWIDEYRQVGVTGQVVSPKIYIACGISGAIQHLSGMKKSNFIIAINKDKEAPIREVADVFVAADLLEFVPILTDKLLTLRSKG